jgi:hypothetical protein
MWSFSWYLSSLHFIFTHYLLLFTPTFSFVRNFSCYKWAWKFWKDLYTHPSTIVVPRVRIYDLLCFVLWLKNTPILLSANSLKTMILSEKQALSLLLLVLLHVATHTSEIRLLITKDRGIMGTSIWLRRIIKGIKNMYEVESANG